jgi:hypothetical protein
MNTVIIAAERVTITAGYISAHMIFPFSSLDFSSFILIVSIESHNFQVTSHISIMEISKVENIFGYF